MPEYTGVAKRILSSARIKVGDQIRVESRGRVYEGILMPRSELGDDRHLVLKLPSGYNIGIRVGSHTKLTLLERGKPPKLEIPKLELKPDPKKPNVSITARFLSWPR